MSNSLQPHGQQHMRLPCSPLSPGVCSSSCPLSQWYYLTISSSATHLSFAFSLPSIRVFPNESALCIRWPKHWSFSSASVFPMNIQNWFPLGWTGLISLQSKGLSRVFSNSTVQKHQFFGAQSTLSPNSVICTWLLEKPKLWLCGPLLAKWCLCFLVCCLGSL